MMWKRPSMMSSSLNMYHGSLIVILKYFLLVLFGVVTLHPRLAAGTFLKQISQSAPVIAKKC